jgi:hypothetical protein
MFPGGRAEELSCEWESIVCANSAVLFLADRFSAARPLADRFLAARFSDSFGRYLSIGKLVRNSL